MNMAKLRQILEFRRATKMPPLLPPKRSKKQDEGKRNNQREILDIHLKLREFIGTRKTENGGSSIVCAFSESEETQRGPWKVTTASELLNSGFGKKYFELPNVFAIEFQLERQQYLRLDICDLLETQNEAKSFGYCVFSVSELVCARNGKIQRKLINDETGQEIAEALLSCTLRPKTHAIILQFAANNLYKKGINATTQIFFEIYRLPIEGGCEDNTEFEGRNNIEDELNANTSNGQRKISISGSPTEISGTTKNKNSLIYRSESLKWNSGRIIWRTFTVQSSEIYGGNQQLRFRCLQELDQSKLPDSPPQVLGEFRTDFNKLQRGQGFENIYFLSYEGNRNRKKSAGTFELCRFHQAYNPSFLEYIFAGSFLNLAFAVDFSRSDSAVDENNLRRYVSDVELSISAFGEPLREFQSSNSYAAFGLGAKIPPQFRESQEFCLNLETDPYCRGLSSVFSAFKTSFVNVQPLNMAHLSHVIYYVAKLAQNSLSRASPALSSGMETITDYNAPNYFVLVIITRGVFDDLKETVQAIIFASRSPISIIFVEICNDQKREEITELERLATAGTRLNYHGRKPERDCTQYVSIASCRFEESKQNDLKALIAERGLSTIGQQMCTWMLRNGYQKVPPTVDMQMLDPILTDVPAQNISLTVQSNRSGGPSTSTSSNATTISRPTSWKRSLFNQFSLRQFRKTSKQRNQNNQKQLNSASNRSTST
uniref:Copine C-terminal domain-containing protein n=1 Tax=Meloidogyne incognita TaxID=6306 RepID=A0A914N3P8_MELIC